MDHDPSRRKSAGQQRPKRSRVAVGLFLLFALALLRQGARQTGSDRSLSEPQQRSAAKTNTLPASKRSAAASALGNAEQSSSSDAGRSRPVRYPPQAPVDTLACQPQVVTKSDTLVLSMQASHGGDLGVTGPDSTFYWVVRDWKDLGDVLNASEEFRGLTRLRLPVEDASALPAVYGVDKPKRLFRKAGTYTFHLSEELETNSGTPVAECKVEYQAS